MPDPRRAGAPKPAEWRRWLGNALRSAHLGAVVLLGAQQLGAGHPWAAWGGPLTLASGLALLASEWADARIRLFELAGLVVLAKLALVGWMVADPARAPLLFWPVLLVSGLSAHAPRRLRHWQARAASQPRQQR